ncbi:MAG TPA: hypothetical protein VF341_13885 [Anaeromyxobacteraceae bacterium]
MSTKKRLGEMLIEAGIIDETQLLSALGHQRKWGGKLGQALIDLKFASEQQIVSALARKFGYPAVSLAAVTSSPQLDGALKLVPRELALRQSLLPLAADTNSITVAMADPSNIAVVDEISFRTGRRVKVALAGDREIAAAVRRLYFAEEEAQRTQAIPLEEPLEDAALETTSDPFSAMPNHVREGYFNRSAHTVADGGRPAAPPPLPGGRPASPPERMTFTPPPLLAPSEDPLGEPILATELAPDAGSGDGGALLEALERAARGEAMGQIRPAQLLAALVKVLIQRGVLSEAELAAELARNR